MLRYQRLQLAPYKDGCRMDLQYNVGAVYYKVCVGGVCSIIWTWFKERELAEQRAVPSDARSSVDTSNGAGATQ